MTASVGRNSIRPIAYMVLAGCLMMLMGCSEVFTRARASREEGLSLYSKKAYSEAAGAFRNAIRQEPRDYESQYWLGVCYDHMELHQQAFSQYRAATDILPATYGGRNDPEFRHRIYDGYAASVAKYDNRDVEVEALIRRAQETQRADEWIVLAKTYRLRGDADSAIDAYRRATNYAANDFYIRKEYGLYLLNTLHQKQAGEYQLALAYHIDPNDEEVVAALRKLGALPKAYAPPGQQAPRGSGMEGTVSMPRD